MGEDSNTRTCSTCGAPILFVRTSTGRSMPLNAGPRKGVVVQGGVARVVDVYESHFETCPQAARHRRAR